jgi:hypothetical protein
MAIRKSNEETFLVAGHPEQVIDLCAFALKGNGFTQVVVNPRLGQLEAKLHKLSIWGEILITLFPDGNNTKIVTKTTANVDNVFALFSSPTKKIIDAFKAGL